MSFAELFKPPENSLVEFWCHSMSEKGTPRTGIMGWFRDGKFWSLDNADHYAPGEVSFFHVQRSALMCAARGCDGCRVCQPTVKHSLTDGAKP